MLPNQPQQPTSRAGRIRETKPSARGSRLSGTDVSLAGPVWQERLADLAEAVSVTDYCSPASVDRHNTAADRLRLLIAQVGNHSAAQLDELLGFLDDSRLRGWVAYGVLDQCDPSQAQRSCRASGPPSRRARRPGFRHRRALPCHVRWPRRCGWQDARASRA